MSIVLVGPRGPLGVAVFERLQGQGDDVRVVDDDDAAAREWKRGGGYVALARDWDADLIERASYEARTIVLFERPERDRDELLEAVLQGASAASVDRLILVRDRAEAPALLASSRIDHVVIGIGKRSRLRRSQPVADEVVASAVDAADDLEGRPRVVVDLTDPRELRKLNL